MKKNTLLIVLLCLVMLLQSFPLTAMATEVTEEEEETEVVTEEETVEITYAVPEYTSTSAPVLYGCRTINAQIPLAGSERMLDSAKGAFVYEVNTGTVLYAYNPDLRVSPGSLVKLVTALVAIEYGNLNDKITVSTREISKLPVGAITSGLKNGEVVTLEDVLHCLIIESANDAALVLAEYVAGSEADFVPLMNERIQEMGCTDTYFTNCHGLDDSNQYTTARDMAKITTAACENEIFKELFGTVSYTVPATNKMDEERKLESGNHLMYQGIITKFNDSRVTGAMPSYTSAASGASITFTAEDNGMDLVFVILGATRTYASNGWKVEVYGNFEEALDLLEFAFSGYKISRVFYSGQAFKSFQVGNGQNNVVGMPMEEIDSVVPTGTKMSNYTTKYTVAGGGLSAPIRAGDKVATVQLWYATSCIAETTLYAMSDIASLTDTGLEISNAASRDDSDLSGLLGFLGVVALVILIPMAVYLTYNSIMRSRVRAKRRRRRASRRRSR